MAISPPADRPVLVLDTETTGYHDDGETEPQPPRLVQLAWGLYAPDGFELAIHAEIVRPDDFTIPAQIARKVHGIDTARARRYGLPRADVLARFVAAFTAPFGAPDGHPGSGPPVAGRPERGGALAVRAVVGHNLLDFDREILIPELGACGLEFPDDADAPGAADGGRYAVRYVDTLRVAQRLLPDLAETSGQRRPYALAALYRTLFGEPMRAAGGRHNAVDDVRACARVYFELRARAEGA